MIQLIKNMTKLLEKKYQAQSRDTVQYLLFATISNEIDRLQSLDLPK